MAKQKKRWQTNERTLGADRFGKVKERKGQMTHLWDEQKMGCHRTFVLNILKDIVLTPITEAHTVAVGQIYDYYRKLRCRKLHQSRSQQRV